MNDITFKSVEDEAVTLVVQIAVKARDLKLSDAAFRKYIKTAFEKYVSKTVSVTPFELTLGELGFRNDQELINIQMGGYKISKPDLPRLLAPHYSRRREMTFEPQSQTREERDMEACEHIWTMFQNIDENHRTPDRGRSLAVGDIVRIEDHNGTRYFQCMNFGWNEIKN